MDTGGTQMFCIHRQQRHYYAHPGYRGKQGEKQGEKNTFVGSEEIYWFFSLCRLFIKKSARKPLSL
jgi:hypothetical protein